MLKTLKDLKKLHRFVRRDYCVGYDELRKEAIKWVKSEELYGEEDFITKQWIKHFFNLTEEDLKDGHR